MGTQKNCLIEAVLLSIQNIFIFMDEKKGNLSLKCFALTHYSMGYFSDHNCLFLDNIEKKIKKNLSKNLNTFENIIWKMEHLQSKPLGCSIGCLVFKLAVPLFHFTLRLIC